MTSKQLPQNLTSYDLLKAVAVIIMIIDHIGFYFFLYEEWWRAIGRIGFPVWFFLIGHASGRSIPPKLWGGALVLIGVSLAVGMPLFPLNALVTIILLRLLIDPVMRYAGQGTGPLVYMGVLFTVLAIPTGFITEYGTLGLLFAVFGYAARHRDRLWPEGSKEIMMYLTLGCFISFAALQQILFNFSQIAFFVMAGGTLGTCLILMGFRAMEFPRLSARIPRVFKAPIQFMGRRTLEIYIVHLLLFKAAAAVLDPERFPLFAFSFFMAGGNG